jgi:hypothetical protein
MKHKGSFTGRQDSAFVSFQRSLASGVLVRDNDGRMIPVGRDGMVYLFAGDTLRKMTIKASKLQ